MSDLTKSFGNCYRGENSELRAGVRQLENGVHYLATSISRPLKYPTKLVEAIQRLRGSPRFHQAAADLLQDSSKEVTGYLLASTASPLATFHADLDRLQAGMDCYNEMISKARMELEDSTSDTRPTGQVGNVGIAMVRGLMGLHPSPEPPKYGLSPRWKQRLLRVSNKNTCFKG